MRRMVVAGIVFACAAFIAGGAVQGQRQVGAQAAPTRTPTPVEVTNFPTVQAVGGSVQVGNLPLDADGNLRVAGILVAASAAIRFVGFTEETFPIPQTCCERMPVLSMNRACATAFPGARACDYAEVFRSIPPPPPLPVPSVLIVDKLGTGATYFEGNCIHEDGTFGGCGAGPLPVACCGF